MGGPCNGGTEEAVEKPSCCHPEEPQATKDLRSSLKMQLPRFFASPRMTVPKRFSAGCEAPPFPALQRNRG